MLCSSKKDICFFYLEDFMSDVNHQLLIFFLEELGVHRYTVQNCEVFILNQL